MKKVGWTGRVFEDFTVGDVYEHPLGRTILAADNTWFTLLTMNTNSVRAAYTASKWTGFVFIVNSVNQVLSAARIVRPSGCS